MFKILHQEKYFNALQQKNLTQWDSICDQTVKNLSTSIQTEIKDDTESLNDIMMIDKSVKHISISREKKWTKKFKN